MLARSTTVATAPWLCWYHIDLDSSSSARTANSLSAPPADLSVMPKVSPSRFGVGISIAALVLVGSSLTAELALGQPRAAVVLVGTAVTAGDEAAVRRSDALLALLPRLETDVELRRKPDLHRAVAAMLVQERAALRESGRAGALKGDEGATADVLMVVGLRLLPHTSTETRPALLSALVAGYYAPGSRFAADLAVYGAAIVNDTLRLVHDESALHRANGYVLMGRVLNNDAADVLEDALSVEQSLDLVSALRGGLADDDENVRALVVEALVAAGDGGSVRTLKDLGRRDVSPLVRQRAREAVTTLSQ